MQPEKTIFSIHPEQPPQKSRLRLLLRRDADGGRREAVEAAFMARDAAGYAA